MAEIEFGDKGGTDKLLAQVTRDGTKLDGQAATPARLAQMAKVMASRGVEEHQEEAAGFTEDIIRWLNDEGTARDLTPEQRIFAISLVTINLRQHFPNDLGGKDFFDEVSKKAWEYFAANKG